MSTPAPVAGDRHGRWALGLGFVGLAVLFGPGLLWVALLGTAASVTAVVLGVTGVVGHAAGRASTRAPAVAGILLGAVGSLMWLLAIIGMVVGV